ncbi:MAG TPA: hypothetical protein DDX54_04115 [Rhodospirillaceae bacterium]|nr:hypothetical protein [Alphaproteobacteria bacterium]HBH26570.1 hypothetical protein [Rhodospirillaceae bacterium]
MPLQHKDIPHDIRPPKTAQDILEQAMCFAGRVIPALEAGQPLGGGGTAQITNKEAPGEAVIYDYAPGFPFTYFLYKNDPGWDGCLDALKGIKGSDNHSPAITFFHELGHIILHAPKNMEGKLQRFFNEQAAVTIERILGTDYHAFKEHFGFEPKPQTHDYEPFSKFSIYEISPAGYFLGNRGLRHNGYIGDDGIVRFDRIVADVASLDVHFYQHLRMMQFLADWWDANKGSDFVREKSYRMFFSDWWHNLQGLRPQEVKLGHNFYAGQHGFPSDLDAAKRYYADLLAQCRAVAPYAPNDPLLPDFIGALEKVVAIDKSPIVWCSAIQPSMNRVEELSLESPV